MDRSERFYRIDQMLTRETVVSLESFLDELEISRATFKRDLEYLRDRLNAPVIWDRDAGGYRYDKPAEGPAFALPGLWFNASEAHALLMMQQLLSELQPDLLGPHIAPLQARLRALINTGKHSAEEIEHRFRLVHAARRKTRIPLFGLIASATLDRQQLRLTHYNRERDETLVRDVSPQQIVYYRDHWYLDAWCHLRNGLRSFSLDAIRNAEQLDSPALSIEETMLRQHFERGYGIFSGQTLNLATLRFSAERARWVADEIWHPQQQGRFDAEGRWLLDLPYSDERELIMDILRHGTEVEVLAPSALRAAVRHQLIAACAQYKTDP